MRSRSAAASRRFARFAARRACDSATSELNERIAASKTKPDGGTDHVRPFAMERQALEGVRSCSAAATSSGQPAPQGNGCDREQVCGERQTIRCHERACAADEEDQR